MQRIQADDVRAFEELYDRYSARAFGVARGICLIPAARRSSDREALATLGATPLQGETHRAGLHPSAEAVGGNSHRGEDAVQEGFLAVWRRRGSFDPARGSVRAWLFTVIRHRSLDLTRRTRRDDDRRPSGDALGFLLALDSVEQDAEAHAEAARVRGSLLKLPVTQREVILLAYFAGLTHTEIAARLKLPTGTVKGRMRLGLRNVAELNPSSPPHQRQTHTKLDSRPSPAPQLRRGSARPPPALSAPRGGRAGETPRKKRAQRGRRRTLHHHV